ncbi:MAG TPA: hypothetical protein VFZ34_20435 [Blastocatellia bacterium]|nr:hypothetical protein [Blastocatellia bacterium]
MAVSEYQLVVKQAEKLSPQEQLRLIQQLAEKLSKVQLKAQPPQHLQYGKYRDTPGREFATDEDFKLAEWHPTEEQLNGD